MVHTGNSPAESEGIGIPRAGCTGPLWVDSIPAVTRERVGIAGSAIGYRVRYAFGAMTGIYPDPWIIRGVRTRDRVLHFEQFASRDSL